MTDFKQNNLIKFKAAKLSLIVGLGMFTAKIAAYFITGSSAIFSDAAESVVHVAATLMALYSIYLSSKPADESHLYGHGNVEYFSAGVEGFLIILAAITIIYYAVEDLVKGVSTKSLDIGVIIIAIAGVLNLFLGFYLVNKGKQTNSLTLVADGKHVLTDSYTSIGVVIGLLLVLFTGILEIDPIIAIAVALNILFTGFKLMRESIGGLMHETDKETLDTLVKLLNNIRKNYWIDIHHLRFMKSGDRLFVDFHIILPFYFSIKESHLEEQFIEDKLNELFLNSSVRIHNDYCKDHLCKFCKYEECNSRKENFQINIDWNIEKLISDPLNEYSNVEEYKTNKGKA
jgi:cation diffusion facilitator family transporter